MPQQRRLDLAGLDAEAAQLHLLVGAPDELQHPVGAPARQIPGAVHPAARRPERVRHKPLRRQPGPPQIAARQPRSRNVKLPNNARRNRLQAAVQHINPRVPDRPANRRDMLARQRLAHGRADRRLRRAVGVDHAPARSTSVATRSAEHASPATTSVCNGRSARQIAPAPPAATWRE